LKTHNINGINCHIHGRLVVLSMSASRQLYHLALIMRPARITEACCDMTSPPALSKDFNSSSEYTRKSASVVRVLRGNCN